MNKVVVLAAIVAGIGVSVYGFITSEVKKDDLAHQLRNTADSPFWKYNSGYIFLY